MLDNIDKYIGPTTLDEYMKHIENDPALEICFQPVKLPGPTRMIRDSPQAPLR